MCFCLEGSNLIHIVDSLTLNSCPTRTWMGLTSLKDFLRQTQPSQVENTRQPLGVVLKGHWKQRKAPNEDNVALEGLKGHWFAAWELEQEDRRALIQPAGDKCFCLLERVFAVPCMSTDAHESTSRHWFLIIMMFYLSRKIHNYEVHKRPLSYSCNVIGTIEGRWLLGFPMEGWCLCLC